MGCKELGTTEFLSMGHSFYPVDTSGIQLLQPKMSLGIMKVNIHMMTSQYSAGTSETPLLGFPGGPVVKNPPANAGDRDLTPVLERSTVHKVTEPIYHYC